MPVLTTAYVPLAGAIFCEVIATALLQRSEQFTRLVPTLGTGLFYAAAFYLLSLALRTLPLGVAYAIWSGIGIVLTAAVGLFVFRQTLDMAALLGIGLIVLGCIVLNVFSQTVTH